MNKSKRARRSTPSNVKSINDNDSPSAVKILNDERISVATPMTTLPINNDTVTTAPVGNVSPEKPMSLSIAKIKNAPKRKANQEHYVLKTIKGEKDNDDSEIIDFVIAEGAAMDNTAEETEEINLSDEEEEQQQKGKQNKGKSEELTEHVCGKCYRTFRRLNGLRKHLDFCRYDSGYHLRKAEMLKNLDKIEKDSITMENKDICFCCAEGYDTFHLGHINCPDCPKSFKSQMSYERHIFITHSESDDYPCEICNAKLRSETLLKLHHEQHRSRGKPFACKICGKDFTRAYHLKRHQKYSSCSADFNDSMSCKVCNKMFYRLDNLRMHLKKHLGNTVTKRPEYTCSICKNCFYSLSTLNIHTRTHTGERPFDCDLCEKKFPSLVALKKHRRYHTGEKPYTCVVCSQSFAVKEVLNRHMKRHTGEKPHKCPDCGKCFIQSTQLKTHARTHLRPNKCDVPDCNEAFKTVKQLANHKMTHTKQPRRNRNYCCHECNIFFSSKGDYNIHCKSNSHQEAERNAKRTDCEVCKKDFPTTKELQFHKLKDHKMDYVSFTINESMEEPQSDQTQELVENEVVLQTNGHTSPRLIQPKIYTFDENELVEVYSSTGNVIEANEDLEEGPPKKKSKLETSAKSSGGLMVREFILDELPLNVTKQTVVIQNNQAFTVIPFDSPEDESTAATELDTVATSAKTAPALTTEATKDNKKSLAESLAAAIADDDNYMIADAEDAALNAEDLKLKENVSKLLDMLVDKMTLKKFGWPEATEEMVLCKVIENCGYNFSQVQHNYLGCDYATRMREYVKLLFTVVIHNESIKSLLNNYPIDEVIEYVLGNDDSDEDDDDDEDSKDAASSGVTIKDDK